MEPKAPPRSTPYPAGGKQTSFPASGIGQKATPGFQVSGPQNPLDQTKQPYLKPPKNP